MSLEQIDINNDAIQLAASGQDLEGIEFDGEKWVSALLKKIQQEVIELQILKDHWPWEELYNDRLQQLINIQERILEALSINSDTTIQDIRNLHDIIDEIVPNITNSLWGQLLASFQQIEARWTWVKWERPFYISRRRVLMTSDYGANEEYWKITGISEDSVNDVFEFYNQPTPEKANSFLTFARSRWLDDLVVDIMQSSKLEWSFPISLINRVYIETLDVENVEKEVFIVSREPNFKESAETLQYIAGKNMSGVDMSFVVRYIEEVSQNIPDDWKWVIYILQWEWWHYENYFSKLPEDIKQALVSYRGENQYTDEEIDLFFNDLNVMWALIDHLIPPSVKLYEGQSNYYTWWYNVYIHNREIQHTLGFSTYDLFHTTTNGPWYLPGLYFNHVEVSWERYNIVKSDNEMILVSEDWSILFEWFGFQDFHISYIPWTWWGGDMNAENWFIPVSNWNESFLVDTDGSIKLMWNNLEYISTEQFLEHNWVRYYAAITSNREQLFINLDWEALLSGTNFDFLIGTSWRLWMAIYQEDGIGYVLAQDHDNYETIVVDTRWEVLLRIPLHDTQEYHWLNKKDDGKLYLEIDGAEYLVWEYI